ncbi:MAG: hypothetical protein K2Q34_00765 [Alphaproteobacteria bacterium]|nr:hypothetical protein [Alphaproteobacteria bacterium]
MAPRLHRSELSSLLKWLNKPNKKPLVIRRARQVRMSTLVRQVVDISGRFCLKLNLDYYRDTLEAN